MLQLKATVSAPREQLKTTLSRPQEAPRPPTPPPPPRTPTPPPPEPTPTPATIVTANATTSWAAVAAPPTIPSDDSARPAMGSRMAAAVQPKKARPPPNADDDPAWPSLGSATFASQPKSTAAIPATCHLRRWGVATTATATATTRPDDSAELVGVEENSAWTPNLGAKAAAQYRAVRGGDGAAADWGGPGKRCGGKFGKRR